jgi:predicted nucleic-acid-binding Zn-ribbon protein
MSEVKKCPECGGEMEQGDYLREVTGPVRLIKYGDFRGDKVIPFYCKNCGFIKLYREMKEKKD